ncbi:MAG: Hpt domain-containing protein [Sphingomonas sp.]|nr:Hpt domain-containing protein [Sphingomonas sp.]
MSDFDDRMAQLRARFVFRAQCERTQFEAAMQSLDRVEMKRLAHGLAGSAGVFGFHTISLDAQAVEVAVDAAAKDDELRRLSSLLLRRLNEAVQPD